MSSVVSAAAADADAFRFEKLEKVRAVLQLLSKDGSLSRKQLDYCNDACIERYLKYRGGSVRKAAKLLKSTLAWRQNYDVDHLIADEFSAELASGISYVAGHDSEGRPVVVVRRRNVSQCPWSHKQFLRYLTFTMEVAIASMGSGIDQWVLILDIGHSKFGSPSSNTLLGTLKLINEHYPERLAKAFVVDCPTVLYYLWKSVSPFYDNGARGKVIFISSKDYQAQSTSSKRYSQSEDQLSLNLLLHESPSHRLQPIPDRIGGNDSALLSGKHSRSFSFSSLASIGRSAAVRGKEFSSFRADANSRISNLVPLSSNRKLRGNEGHSFRLGRRSEQVSGGPDRKERASSSFKPYVNFYKAEYNEITYRASMKPPLSGLKSIISFLEKNIT